ncbi:MAG: hypothetical protein ACE5HQ_12035 [Gemmatimonadota bacterium]
MLQISGDEIDVDRIEREADALGFLNLWRALRQQVGESRSHVHVQTARDLLRHDL